MIPNFLIHAIIKKNFNSTGELIITIGIPGIEAKAEIETYPAIVETKTSKYLI